MELSHLVREQMVSIYKTYHYLYTTSSKKYKVVREKNGSSKKTGGVFILAFVAPAIPLIDILLFFASGR
jgi:hypothetical protein